MKLRKFNWMLLSVGMVWLCWPAMSLADKVFTAERLPAESAKPVTPTAKPEEVPAEARGVINLYEKAAATIRERAEAEIKPFREQAILKLKALQDQYCKAAKLNEALAIREAIRQVAGIRPDPGVLHLSPEDIGKTILFEATGSLQGSVWGSEVFTSDSHLGTAAVHSGVLKPGEVGVLKVRVLAGQKSYQATTSNGVTSQSWGPWNISFTVERSKESAI
jgi:hypothetical protein